MSRIILVVMTIVVMTSQAWAEDWKQVEKNKFFTGYMDYDTIKPSEDKNAITFWVKNEFTKEGSKKMSSKKQKASHSMQRFTANCVDSTLISHEFYLYNKSKVTIQTDDRTSQMSLIPGSVSESIHNIACGVLASIRMREEAGTAKADEAK